MCIVYNSHHDLLVSRGKGYGQGVIQQAKVSLRYMGNLKKEPVRSTLLEVAGCGQGVVVAMTIKGTEGKGAGAWPSPLQASPNGRWVTTKP